MRQLTLALLSLLSVPVGLFVSTTQGQITEAPAPTATATISAEHKSMELLAKFQHPQSLLWLAANGETFLALYQPALRGDPRGSVILLHADGQHAAWPGSLNHLRLRLPELGWNTLSISLPEAQVMAPLQTNNDSAPTASEVLDETEEIFDPTTDTVSDGAVIPEKKTITSATNPAEAIAVERIVAAVAHLAQQNSNNIVLYGQGLGALRGGHFWHETGDNSVAALIFVDARNGINGDGFKLPMAMNNPRMPILDVIHGRALDVEIDAKQRAEQAAINELQAYQQHWFADDNERLANMVYGFLRRNLAE